VCGGAARYDVENNEREREREKERERKRERERERDTEDRQRRRKREKHVFWERRRNVAPGRRRRQRQREQEDERQIDRHSAAKRPSQGRQIKQSQRLERFNQISFVQYNSHTKNENNTCSPDESLLKSFFAACQVAILNLPTSQPEAVSHHSAEDVGRRKEKKIRNRK
jgi:hypothetical protein